MPTRPITPEDIWRVRRVGQPAPLPDGTAAVVPVTSFDVEANRGTTRLFLVDARGAAVPLTRADCDSSEPAIDPTGTRVAFVRKEDPNEPAQLFVMRLDGGEAEQRGAFPLGAKGPRWLPDGSGILVWSPLYLGHLDLDSTSVEREVRKQSKLKARVTEDRIYRYWDTWLTDGEVHHLFRVDDSDGQIVDLMPSWTRLTTFDDVADVLDIAPDGSEVAFHSMLVDPPYDDIRFGVYTLPISGGDPTPVDPDGPPVQERPRYSPDGTAIVYGVRYDWPEFYADRTRLVRYRRATASTSVLTEQWDRSAAGWEFASDGSIVFGAEDDARRNLYRLRPDEPSDPELVARGGWLHGFRPAGGGRIWCRSESVDRPAEVCIVNAGGSVARVSDFNDELLEELDLGTVEDVRFTGAGGDEVQMWVVYPPGFDPTRRWPLVHSIHGGPHSVSGDLWHPRWNSHAFAAGGYVVAAVNFHGSTSWGNEFARCIQGAWGDMPSQDILAATDHLIDRGFIDTERMALTGGSYGGYLVAWLIGHTDRFAAAICHAGVTNLLGQYATDITHGRRGAFGGEPWDDLDAVRRWSPTDFTAGMTTPTLVIHGDKDYRVVPTQGLELYGLLKAMEVPARLVYYPDEGHWILKPQNSLHWHGEFLGWLERYLGRPVPAAAQEGAG
jgi:dipeptidyl aminopeptidase/acylaminoacyl peptidase